MTQRAKLTIAALAWVGSSPAGMGTVALAAAAGPGSAPTCESLPQGAPNTEQGDREGENEPLVIGGNSRAGDLSTTGGLVVVGLNAEVGHIKTRSGPVIIGGNGSAASITTESGSIETCSNGKVAGDVTTTTGSITLGGNTEVAGRIVVRKTNPPPATPPTIKVGINAEARGIELGYPVRICYGANSSSGGVTGAKALPCK